MQLLSILFYRYRLECIRVAKMFPVVLLENFSVAVNKQFFYNTSWLTFHQQAKENIFLIPVVKAGEA